MWILTAIQRPTELPVVNVVALVLIVLSVIPVYLAHADLRRRRDGRSSLSSDPSDLIAGYGITIQRLPASSARAIAASATTSGPCEPDVRGSTSSHPPAGRHAGHSVRSDPIRGVPGLDAAADSFARGRLAATKPRLTEPPTAAIPHIDGTWSGSRYLSGSSLELEQAALAAEPVGRALVFELQVRRSCRRPPSRRRDRLRWPS